MTAEQEGIIKSDERQLLQSIVDFGGTLVREVMTPRPDIVAIRDTATVGDVRALFREQEYSRFPVYQENLDNILGIIRVKDLLKVEGSASDDRPITTLIDSVTKTGVRRMDRRPGRCSTDPLRKGSRSLA